MRSVSKLSALRPLLGMMIAVSSAHSAAEPGPALPSLFPRYATWFPPPVPISGEPIDEESRPGRDNRRLEPPSGLADFVNENFYPPLSTRLHARSLGSALDARLEAYRGTRGALVNELADQMVALNAENEEQRRTQLRAFAREQSPRIAALEREAEELRSALIDGGLLQLNVDWNRRRHWAIGVTRFDGEYAERDAQFQVVRAAAYYQDGLALEQRGLLLEVAYELRQRAHKARPVPGPRRGDPAAMYFMPATTRMRLPTNASPEIVALIGRFNREKTALKQELHDTVLRHDKTPRDERTPVFAALADAQWPRLVELETLAEEIRVALATLSPARLKAPPHIPPGLMERIEAYNHDRQKFLQAFQNAMQAAQMMVPAPRPDRTMTEDLRVQQARKLAEDRAALRAKVAREFEADTREHFENMRGRYTEIQSDLKLVAAGQFDPETGRPLTVETLLQSYSQAMERFDVFGREEVIYRGYRTAMLMPGLSPEQRRLLLGAALVGLAQPLPYGEYLPTGEQPVPQS